jgi:hypothetical protein
LEPGIIEMRDFSEIEIRRAPLLFGNKTVTILLAQAEDAVEGLSPRRSVKGRGRAGGTRLLLTVCRARRPPCGKPIQL